MNKRAVYGITAGATLILGAYVVTGQGRWPYVWRGTNGASLSPVCDGSFNSYSWGSVLVITSGSTGKICEYSNQLNYKVSFRPNIAFYKYSATGKCGDSYPCSVVYNVYTPFQVTASPDTVAFQPNRYPDREIVTYTITVPSNMTRSVYGTAIAGTCPWFSPIAVIHSGDSPAEAAREARSYWNPPLSHCPIPVVGLQLLGMSGFDVENG